MILKGQGKILKLDKEDLISKIEYSFFVEGALDGSERWRGELLMAESVRIPDGNHYLIELEDGRRGVCSLRKKVNKAVMGLPVRYFYQVNGGSSLK